MDDKPTTSRPDPSDEGTANAAPSSTNLDVTSQAAADIVRIQIANIYNKISGETSTPTQPVSSQSTTVKDDQTSDQNTYDRTYSNSQAKPSSEQWRHYHTAWQDYYRQYYERYYIGEIYKLRNAPVRLDNAHNEVEPAEKSVVTDNTQAEPDSHEAFHSLKSNLLKSLRVNAQKTKRSRHFMPIVVACSVMALFLLIETSQTIMAYAQSYISPGFIDPTNIIIDSNSDVINNDPKLIIPKINIDVPIDFTAKSDYDSQMRAMENGVARFAVPGANALPGQLGNLALSGHSSNGLFDSGKYKFIFARLEKLENGDLLYVNYEGKRYIYSVTKKQVVKPTDVSSLIYPATKPDLTLITCVPIGTANERLLVTAEQISPSPSEAKPVPDNEKDKAEPKSIPGNPPGFLTRLFSS